MEDRFRVEMTTERLDVYQTGIRPIDAKKPFFRKPDEIEGVDCARFFQHDVAYEDMYSKNKITYADMDFLSSDCREIKMRHYFPEKPLSEAEADFPIAFAKVVYTDYLFLEMELAATYAPQNTYCYVIDAKSDEIFHRRIHALAECFPNVIYTKKEFNITSAGRNMGFAHHECLKELIKFDWRYVVLLQNHDFALKTNAELVRIYKWMDGANDVAISKPIWTRIDRTLSYTFEELNLFRKKERNFVGFNGNEPKLNFAKGFAECSLSRAMVEFMIFELNLTTALSLINDNERYGNDEILIPTLMTTDALNVPGGFTHYCIDKGIEVDYLTRVTLWDDVENCHSQTFRHTICIFGVADLKYLKDYPHLFGNKMMPGIDFTATVCWREFLFNKTYINAVANPAEGLSKDVYLDLATVRQRKFDIKSFGTGNTVKLPGPSIDKPNVYEFETTPYDFMYKDLKNKDPKLYTNNGLLYMLERNRKIKRFPQKFQKCTDEFDVIICLEERVYDQALDFLQNRVPTSGERVHVINFDIVDNPQDAMVGSVLVANLCQKLEESEDVDNEMDDILTEIELKNQTRNIMNTVCFY